jgi:hypothetical protein
MIQDEVDMTLDNETQQWLFTKVTGGYTITNRSNNMIITDNGSYNLALQSNSAGKQIFTVEHLGDGYVRIVSPSTSKVFDVNGASTSAGATIGIYDWKTSGNTNQQWSLIEIKENDDPSIDRTNADLASLDINNETLTPSFNSNITNYTVDVDNKTASITILATTADSKATLTGSGVHSLNEGSNTINLVVTAQDKISKKTYTIVVTRELSKNANLASLAVNTKTLTPSFSPEVTDYTVDVDNTTTNVTVVAQTEDTKATLTGSGVHSLNEGSNTIDVVVTAQDKTTQKTYTIVVTREVPVIIINSTEDQPGQVITVYPNPASNQFTISGLQRVGVLTVYETAGRLILRRHIVSPQETIDLSALPKGNYFVHLMEGKTERTVKIIVE